MAYFSGRDYLKFIFTFILGNILLNDIPKTLEDFWFSASDNSVWKKGKTFVICVQGLEWCF